MGAGSQQAATAKDRVLRLVDFLAAYNAQKSPPVHDIAAYRLFLLRDGELPHGDGVRFDAGGEVWLAVDFVDLPPPPAIPAALRSYFEPNAQLSASHRPNILIPFVPADGVPADGVSLDGAPSDEAPVDGVLVASGLSGSAPPPPSIPLAQSSLVMDADVRIASDAAARDEASAEDRATSLASPGDASVSHERTTSALSRADRAHVSKAEQWIEREWKPWSARYRQAQAVKRLYRDLFEQRERLVIDRDAVELVWGFGRVRYGVSPHKLPAAEHPANAGLLPPPFAVDHPVLTIPVEIEVDAASSQLRVIPAGAITVETLYAADLGIADPRGFTAISRSLEDVEEPLDPWDRAALALLVRGVLRAIDHDGIFDGQVSPVKDAGAAPRDTRLGDGDAQGDGDPQGDCIADDGRAMLATEQAPIDGVGPTHARADLGWVLYLRRRRPDYQRLLDDMRRLYEEGATPPDPLQALVIDAPSTLVGEGGSSADADTTSAAAREPLLLPLAANDEQRRILHLAQRRPGVTVQGPPGTGKSHTIANLIGHYVAYGHRVLVVAEKEQALQVLADKIPPAIQDLTVSVLGAEAEGRRRLESAISRIQTRVTGIDKASADHEIERLVQTLDQTDRDIARTTAQLFASRMEEVTRLPGVWEVGSQPSPLEAARWVGDHSEELQGIDDALALDQHAPLSREEIAQFASLLGRVGPDAVAACEQELPEPAQLPTGAVLARWFAVLGRLAGAMGEARSVIERWDIVDDADPAHVRALVAEIEEAHAWLDKNAGGWSARIREELRDGAVAAQWNDFVLQLGEERKAAMALATALAAHHIVVPDNPAPAFAGHLEDAARRLGERGKLGLFAGDAKQALGVCRVDERVPSTQEEVQLCLQALQLDALRRGVRNRWNNQVSRLGGPAIERGAPEYEVGDLLADVEHALQWPQRWHETAAALRALGMVIPDELAPEGLERIAEVGRLALVRVSQQATRRELNELRHYLALGAKGPNASPIWEQLAGALASQLTGTWESQRSVLLESAAKASEARSLAALRDRLALAAPRWTARILADPSLLDPIRSDPGLFARAWQWRQLDVWLHELSRRHDAVGPQRRLDELSEQRRNVVVELVAARAWRRLADNLGDRQRQALNSYVTAVRRFGKTGGKYAARWLTQIRAALNESKDAVPVWIMPASKALESFLPEAIPPFDVLIVDEASQIGLEALPLLSLARTAIVVGDDKQTSPENVGVNQRAVHHLLTQYLSAVPHYEILFDAGQSLYDLAFQKFPDVVMLTEHFRCLPPIIAFSNEHAYDGQIIPLRDKPPQPGWKALGAIAVEDGVRCGAANVREADAIVDLVDRLCADDDYEGMDFGVISLLGSSQSKLIWEKLLERLGPETFTRRRIRCGEAANFQGDERNVIVISTVVGYDPDSSRIGAMTGRNAERRINVAASRARDQMWVVHSAAPDRFPKGDLRAALIRHCSTEGAPEPDLEDLDARCESEFERAVVRRILARGYRGVRVQYGVGRFRIDIVVEGPDARLAVECDGDRWHGEDAWHQDRARQHVLERAGWTFERIRGSAFYRDPEQALEPLWERLDALGIRSSRDT